jgi:hypothetical protein
MRKDVKIVLAAVFVCGLFVGALSYAIYQWASQIRNVGVIRAIGVDVYRDEALTEILDIIDWGLLDPGENRSVSAWVKNTGNDAQKLVMWTEAWNPMNASDWISLSWGYGGSWVAANVSVPVVFTLHVDANIEGVTNFSFDIWVKGVH